MPVQRWIKWRINPDAEAILFLLAGSVIVAVAWVLASIPGHVVASVGAFSIETSIAVAIVLLPALVIVLVILLQILRGVLPCRAPVPAGGGVTGLHAVKGR
jgi:hypothetical protein